MRLLSHPTLRRRARDAARVPGTLGRSARGRGLGLILLAGCGGSGQPDEDFEDELLVKGACGDVYFFAHDDAGEVLLEITLPPVLDQVGPAEVTWTYELPVPDVEIAVSTGTGLAQLPCNDTRVDGGPQVDERWVATEGTITLIVEPGTPPRGTLELEGVHLEGDLHPLDIETFVVADKPLGAVPG